MTHLERLGLPSVLNKGGVKVWQPHPTLLPGTLGGLKSWVLQLGVPKTRCGLKALDPPPFLRPPPRAVLEPLVL